MANIVTPEFRVSYPNVFKPKLNKLSNKEEFSLVALFPKGADLSKLKAAVKEVIEKEWGKDPAKWPKNLKTPFRDQGEREKEDDVTGKMVMPAGYEKGAIFINLKAKSRPGVVDAQVQPILDESQFYAGCWARASVNPYAYDVSGSRGVSLGLNNIQKTRDGDSLGGKTKAEDDFAPIEGAATPAAVSADAASLFS